MKKIFSFLLVLMLLLSINVLGAGFEVVGGINLNVADFIFKAERDNYMFEGDTIIGEEISKDISGKGFYGGLRYFFRNGLGLGVGYDTVNYTVFGMEDNLTHILPDDSRIEEKLKESVGLKVSAPYLELVYNLKDIVTLRGAVSYNNLSATSYDYYYYRAGDDITEEDIQIEQIRARGLGYQIGADLNYPVTENFALIGRAAYILGNSKITNVYDDDEDVLVEIPDDVIVPELNYRGFSFGFGISFAF